MGEYGEQALESGKGGVDVSGVDRRLSLRAGDDDLDKEPLGVDGYGTVGEEIVRRDRDEDTEFEICEECDMSSLCGVPFGNELSPRGNGLLLRNPRCILLGFNVTSLDIGKCLI